jgi:hypothetical protein
MSKKIIKLLIFFLILSVSNSFINEYNYASANDLNNTTYENLIGLKESSKYINYNKKTIVAVIDSGIDYDHPSLKNIIIDGINLIDNNSLPIDEYGHGTAVSGVINHIANQVYTNNPFVKIMPIKSLKANGKGNVEDVVKGIQFAIDQKVQIILLSLSLYRDSNDLRKVIKEADTNNILVIAASGNDGGTVSFPAAYPTVLAVGSTDENKKVEEKSNYGSEIDLVAPSKVYTTSLDGGFSEYQGTSFAAAEVAGVASLISSKYPNLKPYQIRNLLKKSAEDIENKDWDPLSGYGLLRADLALNIDNTNNIYEPNSTFFVSKPLPLGKTSSSEADGIKDNFFYIETPYDGTLEFEIGLEKSIEVYFEVLTSNHEIKYSGIMKSSENNINLNLEKGKYFIRIRSNNSSDSTIFHITPQFHIYKDKYEDNNQENSAYSLEDKSQKLVSTFHLDNDIDWYVLNLETPKKIDLSLTTDTMKIDPVLSYKKKDEQLHEIDFGGAGKEENSIVFAEKGTYIISVKNKYENSVPGEYTLNIKINDLVNDENQAENQNVKFVVDKSLSLHPMGQIMINDSIYVPLRKLIEGLGGTASWDGNTKSVAVNFRDDLINLKINDKNISLNGERVLLSNASLLINDITVFPLVEVNKLFKNIESGWNETTKTLYIHNKTDWEVTPVNPLFFESQGHLHDPTIIQTFGYNSNPPTSGPHDEIFPTKVIMDSPMDKAALVHMLEHGNIILAYNQIPIKELTEMTDWVNKKNGNISTENMEIGNLIFITPWPDLEPGTIKALAWTRQYPMTTFSKSDMEIFRNIWLSNSKNASQ